MLRRFLVNRWVQFTLLSFLVLLAMSGSFSQNRFRMELQFFVFDSLNALFPRGASQSVIIVDYDDDSLKAIGQWPWPRTQIAKLIENLTTQGARAIVFDGVLAEPDQLSPKNVIERMPKDLRTDDLKQNLSDIPDYDDVLAQAIQKSGKFVSAFTYGSYSRQSAEPKVVKPILAKHNVIEDLINSVPKFERAATFLPELENVAAGNGSFMTAPDHDGVLRRTGLFFSNQKNLYPALGLEALRVALQDPKASIKITQNPNPNKKLIENAYYVSIGNHKIPMEENGIFRLRFRPFDEKGSDYISAYKILDPGYEQETRPAISGKIVLIGSSAEGLKDLRSTAIEPFQPGVEIHANLIEQIIQKDFLLRPGMSLMIEANFILFIGVLFVLMAPFVSIVTSGSLSLGLILSSFAITKYAYAQGYLLDPVYPSLCIFLIFVAATILNFIRTEYERRQIRDAFGLYISPDYMKELTSNPEKLKLGGENRELSVIFSDIRNFTTISEGLPPEELIQLMNDFLTPMSDLVMRNKGTIDKYMGDAMMAFWNAPLDDDNHAYNACITALGMQKALEPINAALEKKALSLNKQPLLLKAGIGINTGICAVGNMGSRQRFAYSALGDAVNLASRLEGQTKTYGIDIIVGENTYRQAQGLAFIEIDFIQVKGKTKPERIYGLLGDEAYTGTSAYKSLKTIHNQMIKSYQDAEFEKALGLLQEGMKLEIPSMEVLYKIYKLRLKDLIKNPPESGWDGIYIAKTK